MNYVHDRDFTPVMRPTANLGRAVRSERGAWTDTHEVTVLRLRRVFLPKVVLALPFTRNSLPKTEPNQAPSFREGLLTENMPVHLTVFKSTNVLETDAPQVLVKALVTSYHLIFFLHFFLFIFYNLNRLTVN